MAKKPSTSSSRREFSIPGDELEQHRIQLEHNLQNTDLSLHLSSVQDDGDDDNAADNESLEYPRRGSAPDQFTAFASLDRHSRENLDLDETNIRVWSIHDDEGITPYDVRTMSTAAHHASAVTITAGLTRGGRREPSISGAEYDPERPLQNIIAACHASSDAEDAERSQDIPRPKLSETLQRVGFSPRRPRGGQPRSSQPESSQRHPDANVSRRTMAPRARKPTVAFDTTATPIRRYVQPASTQPHVNVQPPTPSASGSRFTKMARGLARDVRQAQHDDVITAAPAPGYRSAVKDAPSRNIADTAGDPNESRAGKKSSRSRLHLPDVTGLTNAVISPAKVNLERYSVRGPGSKEVEARLMASLNALHARLNHLETENSIARRRVRELEYELDECKRDVVRERTRIMESQDAIDISAARIAVPSTSRAKGKERRNKEVDSRESKYFEVVQEKKALEALVTTLRSHLTRVTSDLASQQQLLEDLRRLRESDALSLTEKAQEINELRTEVERLAGEIEVLRGVVEEGLNERRQARDATEQSDHLEDVPAVNPDRSPVLSARRFIDDEEVDRISVDLDERRSERASNSSAQSSYSVPLPVEESPGDESLPSVKNRTSVRLRRRVQEPNVKPDGNEAESNPPFPKISSERMERLFFSAPRHNATSCRMCKRHPHTHHHHDNRAPDDHVEDRDEGFDEGIQPRPQPDQPREPGRGIGRTYTIEEILERMDRNGGTLRPGDVPPQTVLARVVGELEDEFAHFREVYGNLAEEYRSLDCATQAAKRHVVGDRLRDVIEVLERKGNQIASLDLPMDTVMASDTENDEPQNALTSKFTPAEWTALREFRSSIAESFSAAFPDSPGAWTSPYNMWGVTIDPINLKNARVSVVLMKFLRARNLNPAEARDMFMSTLRWRNTFDIKAAMKEEFPEDVFGKVGKVYGRDKEGHPVAYNLYGANKDLDAVFGDVQRFLRWRVAFMEQSIALLDFETVDQMVQIHDYEGVTLSSRTENSKKAASEASKIFQDHYPEFLSRKFFVNVPSMLTWVFWFFKPFLSAATLAKMSVVGSGPAALGAALLPVIDKDELPVRYGGTADDF